MPRADFEMNLTLVQEEIIQLSSMVETAIYKSVDALKKRDVEASQQVIDEDDLIDLKQQALEERCIELIALESPIAGDLRILISAMMIANELERMGDYAEGIAKISVSMGNLPPLKPLIDIPRMACSQWCQISVERRSKSKLRSTEGRWGLRTIRRRWMPFQGRILGFKKGPSRSN